MSIEVHQFQLQPQNSLTNEQLQKAYAALQAKYTKTLTELNSFKQSSIQSYQKILDQMEKNTSHNDQLIKKLQKKYDHLFHEQRTKVIKNSQKIKLEFQKERSNLREIINSKNQTIQKLSQLLHRSEQEKSQIIEENTQNLINIVKSEENCLESKKYSHTELMKMYQFLLEENNCLKKQLIKVQKTNEKSLDKSRKDKNATQIFYTEQSDKIESMYVPSQNKSQVGKKKAKSKQNSESINMNLSAINEPSVVKASWTYKPKVDPTVKKSKVNVSTHANNSLIVENQRSQNAQKQKDTKKGQNSCQNQKKVPK